MMGGTQKRRKLLNLTLKAARIRKFSLFIAPVTVKFPVLNCFVDSWIFRLKVVPYNASGIDMVLYCACRKVKLDNKKSKIKCFFIVFNLL